MLELKVLRPIELQSISDRGMYILVIEYHISLLRNR